MQTSRQKLRRLPDAGHRIRRTAQKKEADVRALLGKYGPVAPIRGMETPYHYRNKVISTFAPAAGGKLTSGIYAARTHKVLPVESCLLQDEVLDKVMLAVRAAANACRYQPFNEDKGTGLLRHCLLRRGVATGQVMVVLVTAQPVLPGAKNFVKALLAEAEKRGVPVTTVVQNYNPRRTSVVLGEDEKVLYGKGFILDTLCGKTYALSPRSFYQVNPVQTAVLYGLAVDAAHLTGKEVVLDAYCGIGTIGLTASDKARQVVGVEVNRDAVRDAIGNAKHNGVKNARFFAADATAWIREAADAGQKADVVFMDPPREGSTPAFIESVARMAPKRMVYVSCNPETMARDLALLTQKGYRAEGFTPVDMFPHTEHVETVVLLSHKKADSYIHIDVEFGEGEGKIPVDSIAKRAEAYKPKEKVTYKMIKEYIEAKYGFKVHTAYIAEVKRNLGLPMYDAPNAVEELKQPRKHPTPEKVEAIKDALRYFAVI
ncbi:MAG: 23S rRNA (uracil(1939)-C(5))-methyltransferase RlmD [Faecalibacterium prausnitzii]